MQPDGLLTPDELEFIQNMQRNPQLNVRDGTSSLLVNGGTQIKELLTRLVAHEQVTIQAQFANQQMSFPLQLVEDEFHAQHIQLGAPTIYEDGPMVRPWRLHLEPAVPLEDDQGRMSGLWAREISFNGVLVELRGRAKAPKHFALWFNPTGYAPVELRGSRERKTAEGWVAYRIHLHNAHETERLRQYILQQHRLAHPQLHT